MKKFMARKMEEIFNQFEKDIEEEKYLCQLKNFDFSGDRLPEYENEMQQEFYLLRYLPAYLLEYYQIYSEVIRGEFIEDKYSILSLGCGCGIDLWGFEFARQKYDTFAEVKYTGIDRIKWVHSDFFKGNTFINEDIKERKKLENKEYNIIMFPKSIGEFKDEVFESLKDTLRRSEFESDKIVLISSARKTRIEKDTEKMNEIAEIFVKNHRYKILNEESRNRCRTFGGEDHYLGKIVKGMDYPEEIKNYLLSLYQKCEKYKKTGKSCEERCQNIISKYPILTTSQIYFQILYLEREEK